MQNYHIVILGLARWDGEYSSTTISLAKALSKNHQVFYIDNPFTLNAIVKDRKKPNVKARMQALLFGKNAIATPIASLPNLHTVTPRVVLPINWLPKGFLYKIGKSMNDFLLSRTLKSVHQKINNIPFVYINIFNPFYLETLPKRYAPLLNAYYTVDAIEESEYIQKHGPWLEKQAFKKADFGLATSKSLQKGKQHLNTVHYLPNAADVALFTQAWKKKLPLPPEFKNLVGDVIIYTGNMSIREDFELLFKIATKYLDKTLMLVGPINTKRHLEYGLQNMPNVVFTGGKTLEELPAYLQHASVAIIPFFCNKLTEGIYPLKINEYLASGIPVVSSNFSEDIQSFESVIGLAKNQEDFVRLIDVEIKNNTEAAKQTRIAFAEKNNWDERAVLLENIISEELNKKK